MNTLDQSFDLLVGDIQMHINASHTGSGFHAVNCPMCKNKDQQQKKGGFKFEHNQIGYNCFRGSCDSATVYTLGEPIPRKFRALMDAIGVKIPIELIASGRRKLPKEETVDDRYEKNVYKTLSFNDDFTTDIPNFWLDYLADRRFICYDLDIRYVKSGNYKGCIAIPHYFYDKLIGWVYVDRKGTYITEKTSSESMLFIPDRIPPKRPLIVEGHPDAWCFPDTVATGRSTVTKKQAYHLRRSSPIVLPDRTGSKLYEAAKYYDWDVCIPMWKEKDLNESVIKRGILATAHIIHQNTQPVSAKTDILYKRWTKTK